MNSNDIRPIAIGVAAALGAFAAIYVWFEHDPWEVIAGRIALRELTPEERAELERLRVEAEESYQRAWDHFEKNKQQFAAQDAARDAVIAAGFNPDLLSSPDSGSSLRELDLAALVTEIEHAEQSYRNADHHLVYPHREALFHEFTRRNESPARAVLPRADQLRLRIAAARVRAARALPFPEGALSGPTGSYGSFPYPEFTGPDPADYGAEIGE